MGTIKKIVLVGAVALTITVSGASLAQASTVHIVSPGDTYWKISQWYRVDLTELLNANGASEYSELYVGQRVAIPGEEDGYTVENGDTYWKISQRLGIDMYDLLKVNGARDGDILYRGQKIKLPETAVKHTVKKGETFWIISNAYGVNLNDLMKANNASTSTVLYPGMTLVIPQQTGGQGQTPPLPSGEKPYVTYKDHTVRKGDDFWKLGIEYGVPYWEILDVNGLKESSVIHVGQKLKIPVYHVPVKPTPGSKYGELLDWWSEAQYVWPIGADAKITDFYTGQRWNARRTVGANHADVEPLTTNDTNTMKKVWGGSWSWATRPVIVEVRGRKIAASASAMPHDIQYIQNNGFTGHFDVHFYNSTKHVDGTLSESHQRDVKIAAGQ